MVGLIIVALALVWLGYETDWMRVRLLAGIAGVVGTSCDWRLQDNQVTKDMRLELISLKRGNGKRSPGEFNDNDPLCGWGYAYQYRDLKPEYKIELLAEHSKYTFRSNDMNTLRDCFRVYRNPRLKVKVA